MINAGFTCPNIDGTVKYGGCTFCSTKGSGDFAGNPEDNTKAGWLESWLTRIFVGIGDMVLKLIKSENYGMGSSFTLDGVIFNEYPPTIIDFWGTDGDYTSAVKSVVNETYKIFRTLAIIMYMQLIIYWIILNNIIH